MASELADARETIVGLNERVSSIEQLSDNHRQQAAEFQIESQQHQKATAEAEHEIETLRQRIAQFDESTNQKELQIADLQQTIVQLERELASGHSTLDSITEHSKELRSDLESAIANSDRLTEENKVASQTIGHLQQSIASLEALETERLSVAADLDSASLTLAEQRKQIETVDCENSRLTELVTQLEQTVSEAKQAAADNQLTADSRGQELQNLATISREEKIELSHSNELLQNQVATLRTNIDAADARVAELTQQIDELSNVQAERTKLVDSNRELQQKLESLQTENELARSRAAELEQQMNEIEVQAADRDRTILVLNQQIESFETEIGILRPLDGQLEKSKHDLKVERDINLQLTQKVSALDTEIEQLTAKSQLIPGIKLQLQSIRDEHQQTVSLAEELNGQLVHSQKQIRSLEKKAEVSDAELLIAKSHAAESLELKQQIQFERDELIQSQTLAQQELSTLADRSNRLAEQNAAMATGQQQLEAEIVQLRAQAASQTDALSTQNEKLEEFQTDWEYKSESLRKEIQVQTERCLSLQSQLAESVEVKGDLNRQLSDVRNELADRSEQLSLAESRMAAFESELVTLKPLREKTDDLLQRLKNLSIEHEESLDANANATARIDELQQQAISDAAKIRSLRRDRASIADIENESFGKRAA